MHEVSHACFAYRDGAFDIKVYPFMHWYDQTHNIWWPIWAVPPKEHRKFYFARMSYRGREPVGKHNDQDIAPIYMDCITINFAIVITAFDPLAGIIIMVCAALDSLWWIRGFFWGSPTSDGKRFRYGR
jgi:hypothetical protein